MAIMKQILKSIMGKHYFRLVLWWQLRNSKNYPAILVYQMGKVGSKAVEDALQSADLPNSLLHVHVLSDKGIMRGELIKRSQILGNKEYWRNIYLREAIGNQMSSLRWKVITLVRDPIARNVSAYFENKDLWIYQADDLGKQKVSNLNDLVGDFISSFDHERPVVWFDMEIKHIINIDVYAESFPRDRGYKIYHQGNVDLLVLKLESLSKVFDIAMYEFLGLDSLELSCSNVGSSKNYADLYKKFMAELKLPRTYIERMYSSPYAKHFYSKDELNEFRTRWSHSGDTVL